nr:hypothetical protein [Xanthomonas populi]
MPYDLTSGAFDVNVGKALGPLSLSVGHYDTSEAAKFCFGRQNSQNHLVATATVTRP